MNSRANLYNVKPHEKARLILDLPEVKQTLPRKSLAEHLEMSYATLDNALHARSANHRLNEVISYLSEATSVPTSWFYDSSPATEQPPKIKLKQVVRERRKAYNTHRFVTFHTEFGMSAVEVDKIRRIEDTEKGTEIEIEGAGIRYATESAETIYERLAS